MAERHNFEQRKAFFEAQSSSALRKHITYCNRLLTSVLPMPEAKQPRHVTKRLNSDKMICKVELSRRKHIRTL